MDGNGSSIGYIIALIALVGMSAFFSGTEMSFSSVNRVRMKALANKGDKRAKLVCDLSDQYDRLLSTILIGNNLVNILSSSIATMVFIRFFGDRGVSLSTVVMTVVILIFGEISPKTLAKDYADRFAMSVAPVIRLLILVLTPVNWLFTQWKKLLGKLFPAKEEPGMTEEELLTIVDEAEQGGDLDEHESDLIRSAIEFNDLDAEDILTHRVDVVGVDADDSMDEVERVFKESGFSRLPVYEDNIDNIIGIIHEKDFYAARGAKSPRDIMHPALYVTPGSKISVLLRMLQKAKTHIAVVKDEYGGTAGIVTMEDIIEELVGEIYDEHDEVVEEFKRLPDGTVVAEGSAELDKLQEQLGIPGEFDATTVGGWVTELLGRIPQVGDSFDLEKPPMTVRVSRVDAVHVLEVQLIPRPADEDKAEE